ncbi:pilus assembly protein [Methylomonas sp. MgM2]
MTTLANMINLPRCISLCFGLVVVSTQTYATQLELTDTPLFLTVTVPPNMILTLDDSGSMSRAFTPDLCGNPNGICSNNPDSDLDSRYLKSAYFNPIYYDPTKTYRPPLNASQAPLTTSYTSAYINGFDPSLGTVDLSSDYRPSAGLFLHNDTATHEFMNHYPGDFSSGTNTITGTTTNTNPPKFTISGYTSISSVKVNGTNTSNAGTLFGSCTTSNDPSGDYKYKIQVSGSTATLCFRDSSTMRNKSIEIKARSIGAYYYLYDENNTNCNNTSTDNDCYDLVMVSATSGPGGTDERQNFANWYSFFRTRNLMTVTATSRAMANLPNSYRVAWQSLNSCRGSTSSLVTSDCEGWESTSPNFSNRIDRFAGTHKDNFFKWLFRVKTNTSTPLRQAMERVGEYYKTSGENSPYDNDFSTSNSGELSCRKNFHVMMTDGIWNDSVSGYGNKDNTSLTLPDGVGYSPIPPYKDSNSNSLADIAFNYWATDLRTDSGMDNDLLPSYKDRSGTDAENYQNPRNDPATWQHMVNYTVGLGLSTFLSNVGLTWDGSTYTGSYPDIAAETLNWPSVSSSGVDGNTADVWHAAINSRGKFYNVERPSDLENAFADILIGISDSTSAAAATAANSTSIQTGTVLYQAQFDPNDWSGHLYNFTVSSDGTIRDINGDGKLNAVDANWDAASLIPAAGTRRIVTWNGSAGVTFFWDNLSFLQQMALKTSSSGVVGSDAMGQDRLAWLRGDTSKEERVNGIFRNRIDTILGDIINSDPIYTHNEDFGYANLPSAATERSTYAAFVTGKSSRPPMVYEGANDGMIHGFRADISHADKGKELMAYIPAAVYGNLSFLTEPEYSHRYYVDGSPNVGDTYINGSWKTLLVGGLGKGGKAVFALDISSPYSYGGDTAGDNVLWEYSGSSDPDTANDGTGVTDADGMGYTFSQPQIGRLQSGDWVAIFGNGYNSASERAFLYIVNLSNGGLIRKIPTSTSVSNGLSTPRLYDSDGDKIIDYVYAGDLQGNMWKFDLTSANSSEWAVANSGNPLFIARNASNQIQPITAQPTIGDHSSDGVLVYFGTGSYLTNNDVSDTTVQSFYAIWDNPLSPGTVARTSLVQQSIIEDGISKTLDGCTDNPATPDNECVYDVRATSSNTVDYSTKLGWYLDLVPTSGVAAGERVVSGAIIRYDRVIFLTAIPSDDPCNPGGTSWLMELDARTGSATSISSFDFNNDDKFDEQDLLSSGHTASGVKSNVGIIKSTVWLEKEGTGTAMKEMSGTSSNIMSVKNKGAVVSVGEVKRRYWLQIQ